jgi:hypothetical protein
LIALIILFFRGQQGCELNIQHGTPNTQHPTTDHEHFSHQDRKGPLLKRSPHFAALANFCKIPIENHGAAGVRALP